jgi:alpha-1,2-mannosyltransferase
VVCLAIGGLLASPVSWSHHWVWIVPALPIWFIRRPFVLAMLGAVTMFLAPMYGTAQHHDREFGTIWWQPGSRVCELVLVGLGILDLDVHLAALQGSLSTTDQGALSRT